MIVMQATRSLKATLFLCSVLLAPPVAAQGKAVPVAVGTAQQAEILEQIQLSGTVTARRSAQLSVATAGLVNTLELDAGDRVAANQVLLELDAELANQQYQAARAMEAQARHALDDARRRLAEARELAPKQSIAETVVKDIAAEVAQDQAVLDKASADAAYYSGVLQRHQLKAPFAGVITARMVELGEWIVPGQAAFTLVSTEQLRLDFQAPEDYQGKLGNGQAIEFSLGGGKQARFPATVASTVPASNAQSRTFLVRAVADTPVEGMLPGMSVTAQLRLASGEQGVVVPRDAVLRYADGRQIVWVVEQREGQSVASERLVQTGQVFDGQVEIRRGISAGETVVIKGNEALRSGQAVSFSSP